MSTLENHLARLRQLQRRYECAADAGNDDGCARIQTLIDEETKRWEAQAVPAPTNTKGK